MTDAPGDVRSDVRSDVQDALPGLEDLLPPLVVRDEAGDGGADLLELLPGASGWSGGHDLLWSVVGTHRVERREDVAPALAVVRRRLEGLVASELVTFARQLREVLRMLDAEPLWSLPVRVRGVVVPPSDEGFLDARCACVLAGRDAVTLALADERSFRRFGRCTAAGALTRLADEVHAARTGRPLPALPPV